MILFKTALLNFKKKIMANILIIIEMTAAIIIFAVMISSFLIRYSYYEPFQDMFKGKGVFFFSPMLNGMGLEDDPEMKKNYLYLVSSERIFDLIDGIEKIAGCNTVWAEPTDNKGYINSYGYSDELIKRFKPKLKEGRWLSTSDKADKIEIVVSENNCGWQVGDVIEMQYLYDDPEHVDDEDFDRNLYFNAEIVGIMEKGAKIFGLNHGRNENEDFNMLYSVYDVDVEESPLILFSSQYLYNDEFLKTRLWIGLGVGMIQFPDDASDEQLDECQSRIARMSMGSGISFKFSDMEKGNKKYLYEQIYNLLPVIIVIIILVIVSSASSTAIATLRRLRDYSIYYITGLQWKQCVLINLIQSAVISVLSLIIAAGALYFVKFTPLGESVTVIAHPWTALSAVGLILLYVLVSMVMPIIIIGKSTPKEILTR